MTNMACIGISPSSFLHGFPDQGPGLIYSVIAPLIIVLEIVYFGALWILYRFYPPRLTERDLTTPSLFYPTAIRQLLTGIYFMELCLAGLFFLVRDAENNASCTPQAGIMLAATALTALFHYALAGRGLQWLSPSTLSNPRPGLERRMRLPAADTAMMKAAHGSDETLSYTCPIVWIPRDRRGVSTDEIHHARRNGILMSNEGACLERSKIKLHGPPPARRAG